jgi:hypothetical protein
VMAAQARSLGFTLIFASQDLPSMEKRVKQEAKSIAANCNLKIFGRIEDPIDTKDFLVKHAGTSWVLETKGMTAPTNTVSSLFMTHPFYDDRGTASVQNRVTVDYDHLRNQREGEATLFFSDWIIRARMFYVSTPKVKALRVHRLLAVPGTTSSTAARERAMHELDVKLKDPEWTAADAGPAVATSPEIGALAKGLATADATKLDLLEAGIMALASVDILPPKVKAEMAAETAAPSVTGKGKTITASTARNSSADGGGMSSNGKEDRRAGQTPLQEGDQYAIEDVERAPAMSAQTPAAGFAGTDTDFNVITHPELAEDEAGGVMDVHLSEEIATLLEQSAKKLNRGLAGRG